MSKSHLLFIQLLLALSFLPARAQSPTGTQERPELVLQTGHTLKVNAVSFGPDGRWVVSGGADNLVNVWEVATGRELRTLAGHTGWIKSLAISSDGQRLASGSNDKTIKLWDVQTGQELRTLSGHAGPVEALAFSKDGRLLASASTDNTIKVWDAAAGREVQTLTGHSGPIAALAFSPDGQWLASGGADNTTIIWEVASWRSARTIKKHTDKVTSLAFSQDGQWLASGSLDRTVRVWKVGGWSERFSLGDRSAGVLKVAFSSEGYLISGGSDAAVRLLDLQTGKEARAISGGSEGDEIGTIAFSADGTLSASGRGDRTVEIRSLVNGATSPLVLDSRSDSFYAVAFSGDGRWLASGGTDRSVRLWDLATGRELSKIVGHAGWVTSITFSPDSRMLAAGSMSGVVKVWDVQSGRELFNLSGHKSSVGAIAFSPDGKYLASGSADQTAKLWDAATGREVRTLAGHKGEVTSMAFSPDGNRLASGSTDKTVRLWETGSAVEPRLLSSGARRVETINFSPDGSLLASGDSGGYVNILEVATGRSIRTLEQGGAGAHAVAFSPDGSRLAAGGANKTVRLWEVATGRDLGSLNSHSGSVNGVSFSPEGRWLATASEDGSTIIWDAATGERRATLMSMRGSDDWLVATPDGLFDGSPAAWNLILWRFERDTFKATSVEAFFNEFYYPGILAEIMMGKKPKAVQDISRKDRRQPYVKLTLAGQAPAPENVAARNVTLRIEVSEALQDQKHQAGGGARDLRLFRNGVLVKAWRGDLVGGGRTRTVDISVPIIAGENRFSVYAFNRDNIKSSDAELKVLGAEALRRKGTLYLLAVGVNEYANKEFNLKYAVPDAEDFTAEFKRQQEQLGFYDRTEVISLYNERANKRGVLDAFSSLAKKMQPEDAVVVYFAGHGTIGTCRVESPEAASARDRFYLVPYDLGYTGEIPRQCDQRMLNEVASHSISDEELEAAFEGIDTGKMLLVIDACNSGQALESEEKRRGPMNSKGLAQLAYEKGMYILTAAQSFQEARADKKVAKGHGYLTYALVEEGMKSAAADVGPRDGQVLLREWVDYAVQRVPSMQRAEAAERRQLIKRQAEKNEEEDVQRPRVFYRREADPRAFVVAKP